MSVSTVAEMEKLRSGRLGRLVTSARGRDV